MPAVLFPCRCGYCHDNHTIYSFSLCMLHQAQFQPALNDIFSKLVEQPGEVKVWDNLVRRPNTPAAKPVCHCCTVKPAERESVSHPGAWKLMCQECIDKHYPEGHMYRDDYYPPNGCAV